MPTPYDVLRDFLTERGIDASQIALDSRLQDLGVDSLLLVEAVFQIEDKLDIRIPELGSAPETVADVLDLVEQALAGTPKQQLS